MRETIAKEEDTSRPRTVRPRSTQGAGVFASPLPPRNNTLCASREPTTGRHSGHIRVKSDLPCLSHWRGTQLLTATDYVYDLADLYDKAFSYRDIETGTNFLNEVYAWFSSSNRAPRSVLETASGSGRHALAFAHALTNQEECILSEHTATSMSAPSFDQAKPTRRAGE